jgi:hypothetical protein
MEKVVLPNERRVGENPELEAMMHRIAGILDNYGRNLTSEAYDLIAYSWADNKSGLTVELEYSVGYHQPLNYRTAMNMNVSYPRQETETHIGTGRASETIRFFDRTDHAVSLMSACYENHEPSDAEIAQYTDLINYVANSLIPADRSDQHHPEFTMSRIVPTEFLQK